jgi:hypothetical protein
MSANGSAVPTESSEIQDKGKGRSVEEPTHDMNVDEEDDEQEESGPDEVSDMLYAPN